MGKISKETDLVEAEFIVCAVSVIFKLGPYLQSLAKSFRLKFFLLSKPGLATLIIKLAWEGYKPSRVITMGLKPETITVSGERISCTRGYDFRLRQSERHGDLIWPQEQRAVNKFWKKKTVQELRKYFLDQLYSLVWTRHEKINVFYGRFNLRRGRAMEGAKKVHVVGYEVAGYEGRTGPGESVPTPAAGRFCHCLGELHNHTWEKVQVNTQNVELHCIILLNCISQYLIGDESLSQRLMVYFI